LWKAVKTKPDTVVQHHNSQRIADVWKRISGGQSGAATHFVLTATGCFHYCTVMTMMNASLSLRALEVLEGGGNS
jgi:hypothetical protein